MKLYSEHPGASITMSADPVLAHLLRRVIAEERIECVVETGTFHGLGSTCMLAEAFLPGAEPRRFVTLEANPGSFEEAKRNLTRFPFVQPIWGLSVGLAEALDFLGNDECLRDHARWPEVWIDDVNDPLEFYRAEVRGQLGHSASDPATTEYQGEDLLRRELRAAAGSRLLVALDSAGGVGFLEFSIVRAELRDQPYVLLLDDIHHLKHFRSAQVIRDDSRFRLLGSDPGNGWLLARYEPSRGAALAIVHESVHLHGLFMGHWAGNLGDSAVFDVFDRALPPQVRFTLEVESAGPWSWRRRPQTEFVHYLDSAACSRLRRECAAAVIVGGTIVTDMHGGEWPIAQLVTSIAEVRAGGSPVYALSAGIHPTPEEAASTRFQKLFCDEIAGFSVREEASREALHAAGVPAERIILAADLAWGLERPVDLAAARAELVALAGTGPLVAVNAVHEDWADRDDFYAGIAAELDVFHQRTGATTVFFCNEIRPGAIFDAAAAEHVRTLMRSPAFLLPPRWLHPEEMVARIACCALAVSMRYHFSIFSTLAGTPWTGFRRGQKLRGILSECGMPSAGEMGVAPNGGLLSALSTLWSERPARHRALAETASRLRVRSAACLRPLLAAI